MFARSIVLSCVVVTACADASDGPDASPLADAAVDAAVDAGGADAAGGPCPLVVNEVAPAGAPADWFELVNVGTGPVDLAGYGFIDEADDPAAIFVLPPTVLAPGGRHVQEVTDAANGFQLGSGDALWLYPVGSTTKCDGVDWNAGDAPAGSSWARVPDATGPFMTTTPDTRGVPNR
ncbi:MAG: lamin tail domain-containing protein [Kofleriaceae bacterium]